MSHEVAAMLFYRRATPVLKRVLRSREHSQVPLVGTAQDSPSEGDSSAAHRRQRKTEWKRRQRVSSCILRNFSLLSLMMVCRDRRFLTTPSFRSEEVRLFYHALPETP
jgi:hypothetical protein